MKGCGECQQKRARATTARIPTTVLASNPAAATKGNTARNVPTQSRLIEVKSTRRTSSPCPVHGARRNDPPPGLCCSVVAGLRALCIWLRLDCDSEQDDACYRM